jgi:glyoxylase-like metal-dependent hydrolase (beta-lactamase superfamily II)
MSVARLFAELGLEVFERGWLSSNNILVRATEGGPSTLIDSGYASHAEQTAGLVRAALAGRPLDRVLNTHLHSDHCGGNSLLQSTFGCEVMVPAASLDNVVDWDECRLSYRATGQRCDRFSADGAVDAGETVRLGRHMWQAYAAPGHDPDSLMFFQPDARVLISADALWEHRISIIFPEIEGDPGFGEALAALDVIESLAPAIVIPGHGRCFTDWRAAVTQSRRRIQVFRTHPERHALYGARALTMFHMLEHRERTTGELQNWLLRTPVFHSLHQRCEGSQTSLDEFGAGIIRGLVDSGQLIRRDERIAVVV